MKRSVSKANVMLQEQETQNISSTKGMMTIVLAASASLPGMYESENTPMMWGYGFGWGGMSLMLVSTTLCIALLVILVWALVTWLHKKASGAVPPAPHLPSSGPSALEILQQRYARGEIDTATFEQMRE